MNAGVSYMAAIKHDRPARIALARTGLLLAGVALTTAVAGIGPAGDAVRDVMRRAFAPDPKNN